MDQLYSKLRQNPGKSWITFDTQLKMALIFKFFKPTCINLYAGEGKESAFDFLLCCSTLLQIIDPRVINQPIVLAKDLRCQDIEWKSTEKGYHLSLTLMWHCPINDGQVDEPAHYNIFKVAEGSNIFLGRAFVEAYRIGQIAVSKTCSSIEFAVQVVTRSGRKRPVSDCSYFKLKW